MEKLEYLENGTLYFFYEIKFLTCASEMHFEKLSFCSGGNL